MPLIQLHPVIDVVSSAPQRKYAESGLLSTVSLPCGMCIVFISENQISDKISVNCFVEKNWAYFYGLPYDSLSMALKTAP